MVREEDEVRPLVWRHLGSKRLLMENEKTSPLFPKKSTWVYGIVFSLDDLYFSETIHMPMCFL